MSECVYFNGLLRVCSKLYCVPLEKDCKNCPFKIKEISFNNYEIQNHDLYKINKIRFKLNERPCITPDSDPFVDPFLKAFKLIKYPNPEKWDRIKFNVFNISKKEYQFEIFELYLCDISDFIHDLKEMGYCTELVNKYKKYIVEEAI